ncbi:MAG: hypothetical protein HGB26_05535, partial [Desulfobulbaceae bacterium]|nr:hypothetical protein [Desulfobulbaceae bacterium]
VERDHVRASGGRRAAHVFQDHPHTVTCHDAIDRHDGRSHYVCSFHVPTSPLPLVVCFTEQALTGIRWVEEERAVVTETPARN